MTTTNIDPRIQQGTRFVCPKIHASPLTEFATQLLRAGGVGVDSAGTDEAQLVAESLVAANLRGHDSHGVMRIPYYLDGVAKGEVVPGVPLTIINEEPRYSSPTAIGDSDRRKPGA